MSSKRVLRDQTEAAMLFVYLLERLSMKCLSWDLRQFRGQRVSDICCMLVP